MKYDIAEIKEVALSTRKRKTLGLGHTARARRMIEYGHENDNKSSPCLRKYLVFCLLVSLYALESLRPSAVKYWYLARQSILQHCWTAKDSPAESQSASTAPVFRNHDQGEDIHSSALDSSVLAFFRVSSVCCTCYTVFDTKRGIILMPVSSFIVQYREKSPLGSYHVYCQDTNLGVL